jgi:putative flavoprotein involved in K+ transport
MFTMNNRVLDVIVVGAGQAGLSASYHLKKSGLNHIVLERGKIGESWRSQRWDSFVLNTSNKLNILPGDTYKNRNPEDFSSARGFASSLTEYVSMHQLPVMEEAKVVSVEKPEGSLFFIVVVSVNHTLESWYCRQVIIASGTQSEKKTPGLSAYLPSSLQQLHVADYRRVEQLSAGAVLVVGSAQSGCQVAEDLADAGRKVYLATSMVGRVPRKYRGEDILDWLIRTGFFDVRKEEIEDPSMLTMKPPQLTGIANGTRTISLQSLARKGVIILGRLENADEENLYFQPNAALHVKFADEVSMNIKQMIDSYILQNKLSAPPVEPDENDVPDNNASVASAITRISMEETDISTIIWATGFTADHSYLKLPVFDREGKIRHKDGIGDTEGIYFIGGSWLRSRKSALLYGIKDDAAFIVNMVYQKQRKVATY